MRILYLAHRIPYPPNKGDKIRSFHHLRHLAKHHEVDLIAFVDDSADWQWADRLRDLCASVVLIDLTKLVALARGALSMARGRSLTEGYFGTPAMWRAVRAAASSKKYEVVWAFSSSMVPYLSAVEAARKVVDLVDLDSEKWLQFAATSHRPISWLYGLEARRVRALEARLVGVADTALFVSAEEAELFRSFASPRVLDLVVHNGVDLEYFVAGQVEERHDGRLLFTGALDYRPNVDAVLRFTREVLPLVRKHVPQAHLLAVGHRPSKELLSEAARLDSGLEVAGSVPDIRPYFRGASVYVAPMELGRGVQNKVLEAMAMRLPVVASPLATDGLQIEKGEEIVVAADSAAFARNVIHLLQNSSRRDELAAAGFSRIRRSYSWSENLRRLDDCLAPAADSGWDDSRVSPVAQVS